MKEITFKNHVITNGGLIHGIALIELPDDSSLQWCGAELFSEHFIKNVSASAANQYYIPILDCTFKKIAARTWQIEIKHKITEHARNGNIFLNSILIESQTMPFAQVKPNIRQDFNIVNTTPRPDLKVTAISIEDHLGNGLPSNQVRSSLRNPLTLKMTFNTCLANLDSYHFDLELQLQYPNANDINFTQFYANIDTLLGPDVMKFQEYSYDCIQGAGHLEALIHVSEFPPQFPHLKEFSKVKLTSLKFLTNDFYFLDYKFPDSYVFLGK